MTHLILEKLLTNVTIGGLKYKINSDFKTVMRFEILMDDKEIDDKLKLRIAFEMFFGDQYVVNEKEAIEAILYLYIGKENVSKVTEKSNPIYSFLEDDELIFASFIDAYGMDLSEIELHWWKFKALFFNLPENTIMSKVMGYRAIEIKNTMTKEEKKFYKKMKQLYALTENKTLSEKEEDFANSLWG